MKKGKKYPAELMARVALEVVPGEQTMTELSVHYKIDPNLIAKWKTECPGGARGCVL